MNTNGADINLFLKTAASSTWEIYGKNKDPFEEERFGLLQKILKLKEEIKRLRKDKSIEKEMNKK